MTTGDFCRELIDAKCCTHGNFLLRKSANTSITIFQLEFREYPYWSDCDTFILHMTFWLHDPLTDMIKLFDSMVKFSFNIKKFDWRSSESLNKTFIFNGIKVTTGFFKLSNSNNYERFRDSLIVKKCSFFTARRGNRTKHNIWLIKTEKYQYFWFRPWHATLTRVKIWFRRAICAFQLLVKSSQESFNINYYLAVIHTYKISCQATFGVALGGFCREIIDQNCCDTLVDFYKNVN